MHLDGRFGIIVAACLVFYSLEFWGQRPLQYPRYPLRVHRLVAALAGSQTDRVNYRDLASQVGFLCLPLWYQLLARWMGIENFPLGLLVIMQILTVVILSRILRTYARKQLLEAEYLLLPLRDLVETKGNTVPIYRTVCLHCGYQEYDWDYDSMRICEQTEGRQVALAYSEFGTMFPVFRHTLIDALGKIGATGFDSAPVAGSKPTAWYILHRKQCLPPMQIPHTRLTELPYRTERCASDHGFEDLSDVPYTDFYYRRNRFSALDVNYTYEMFGDRMRRGSRSLVISQRVFRLLVKLERVFPWYCIPIRFVD